MDEATYCIFCRSITKDEPEEHIAPEGLIGEQYFDVNYYSIAMPSQKLILHNDEVCRLCNTSLGKLDSYLIEQYGFLRTLWNRTGIKAGRPATAQRAGMFARRGRRGPELWLNATRRSATTSDGHKIMPAALQPLAVSVEKFDVQGGIGRVVVQQPMRLNERFMRAIHKIAFELLCLQKGAALLLGSEFDVLRNYILRGIGSRTVIMTTAAPVGGSERPFFGLECQTSGPGWLATVRLGPTFFVDLSPANEFTRMGGRLPEESLVLWSDQGGGTFS